MDNKFTKGEKIKVKWYDSIVIAEFDSESDCGKLYWVDLKLMDSSPGHIVMTGIDKEDCSKITEQDDFKHKLQGKKVGIYGDH